jgi:hypothetical protein
MVSNSGRKTESNFDLNSISLKKEDSLNVEFDGKFSCSKEKDVEGSIVNFNSLK